MKTIFFTRLTRAVLVCLLVAYVTSCSKTQEPISPIRSDRARSGIDTGTPGGPPTTSSYPDGSIYTEDNVLYTDDPIELKVVGQSTNINEDTDFRLYPTAIVCQAYEYLFRKAIPYPSDEVGAYITSRGIIIGPNNNGSSGNYRFKTWGTSLNYRAPFIYTKTARINITGMIHTHPSGNPEVSEDDKRLAARFDVTQYVIANVKLYRFNASGTVTQTAHYDDKKCP